jgi:hypothetical protein
MNIQRYRSHLALLAVDDDGENRWANDIDGSALAAQPGKSQGRPLKSPGSKPIAQSGLPNLRSPKGPCPSRPNLSPSPDNTGAFKEQFHAARSARDAVLSPCTRSELSWRRRTSTTDKRAKPRQVIARFGCPSLHPYIHRQGGLTVDADPDLAVDYVDYEVSIVSTRGATVFDDPARSPAGRALRVDLVLANAHDRAPVIGEIKLGRDSDPFVAVVQTLAYIAHLSTRTQYARLRRHLRRGRFPEDAWRFDGYVLLYGFGREANTYLDDLLIEGARVASALMERTEVTAYIRRLVCLRP